MGLGAKLGGPRVNKIFSSPDGYVIGRGQDAGWENVK
jgi:hypothetical protein